MQIGQLLFWNLPDDWDTLSSVSGRTRVRRGENLPKPLKVELSRFAMGSLCNHSLLCV